MSNGVKFINRAAVGSTDTWLTPRWILDELGTFDLDPCAAPNWPTAKRMIVTPEDGLAADWSGQRVWLNPPYSNWGEWLAKLSNENNLNGIALIFARTETRAFFNHVWFKAHGLLFIKGRVRFCRPDGTTAGSSSAPSVLIAYGRDNAEVLRRSNISGKYIPNPLP